MGIVVQKFGGTSVADAECIKNVARRIIKTKENGNQVVAVVSARGKTTDELISLAREITDKPSEREMDMLLATGEQESIALLAMAIESMGEAVISLTGPQVGIRTDAVHSKAKILSIDARRLHRELDAGKIVIVAGFQGATQENEITTMGRGGSDTTAVALAAVLKADVCEIYTDVDGIYSADPRIVPRARKLDMISYDEMLELARLGALVLHPRAVECAKIHHVPLLVKSSFKLVEGTRVEEESGKMEKDMVISGVAADDNVARIAVFDVPDKPGIAQKLFIALAKENINVDMIVQSTMREEYNDISFTVSLDELNRTVEVVERVKNEIGAKRITYTSEVAKVSIVGAGMITNPGVAARMFEALAKEDINIQMITTSEIKISVLVEKDSAHKALRSLHAEFNLDIEKEEGTM